MGVFFRQYSKVFWMFSNYFQRQRPEEALLPCFDRWVDLDSSPAILPESGQSTWGSPLSNIRESFGYSRIIPHRRSSTTVDRPGSSMMSTPTASTSSRVTCVDPLLTNRADACVLNANLLRFWSARLFAFSCFFINMFFL